MQVEAEIQMIFTNICIKEVKDKEIVCYNDSGDLVFGFDTAVICLGLRPNNNELEEIEKYFENKNVSVFNIGDSLRPRKIINGIDEGRNIVKLQVMQEWDLEKSRLYVANNN